MSQQDHHGEKELAAFIRADVAWWLLIVASAGLAVQIVAELPLRRALRVSPTIDPATRSITVYVQVANPSGTLKGGTFVSGRVVGRAIPQALVIPGAAIRQSESGSPYVYTIEGETVAQKEVQIGVVDDATGIVEITSGLEEGDRVIVGNVGTLGRGMQVRVVDRDDRPARR